MKKDWTYKKLGKVCDILNGYAFKSNKYVDEGIRVIRIANVQKGIIVDDQPAFYPLSTQSEIDKYILNEGDILMSLTGNVGRVGILQKEMLPAALNQRVACLRMSDNSLYSKFFFHYLNSDLFEQKCIASAKGIAQLNMSTEWLKEQFIPIPPLSIQRSIVAELDLLHSVISKKKEQLRELDNLAQSLFYQMFGDPITNPMGWEVKKLGEVAENCDFMRKPITASDRIPGNIPYYGASGIVDYVRDYIFDGDYLLVSEDGANLLARSTPIAFSISGKNWVNNHAHVLKFQESSTQLYVQTLINLIDISDIVTGAVQPKLNQAQLNKFPLPLPPLSLQQSFAAKVCTIEAQKQAITLSIKETEALLAQRMDTYFS